MTVQEALIKRSQAGDREAGEQLIKENAGLVWSVARRFVGRGTELDDLYQIGCLGFIKAVSGFDPSFGTQFSTYAVPKIAGEIRRFLRDDGAVKVSRTIKEQAALIKSTRNLLIGALGREPSLQEISNQIGISPEEIAQAESATSSTESIYAETGEEGFSLENILSGSETEESLVEKISLKEAILKLEERESEVIRLRYYHDLTQSRVAKVLGVSQVQISRIEKKALLHLKQLMS